LVARGERSGPDFDLVAVTLSDWSDLSGVLTVRLHIRFRWFCPAEGEVTGSEQQTGDMDPFIANAFGWGFQSFASCNNGDPPIINGATVRATGIDTIGNGGESPHVEVP
jgi:hypothetical protein